MLIQNVKLYFAVDMRKFLIWLSLSAVVAVIGYYFGMKNKKTDEEYKRLPVLYAYHYYENRASIVFVASEAECLSKIDNYYKSVEQGTDTTIPGCFR